MIHMPMIHNRGKNININHLVSQPIRRGLTAAAANQIHRTIRLAATVDLQFTTTHVYNTIKL